MAFKIYWQSFLKWMIGIGGAGVAGVFLFSYLASIGAIEITGFSGSDICAGTLDDPCIAYINFTAKTDIFIYPIQYDPFGRDFIVNFDPAVKDWKIYRSWGTGWREIPLDKICTGTWCGLSNKDDVRKFSIAFREGNNYSIKIVAHKKSPFDTIKWSVDYKNKEYLDPEWTATVTREGKSITYENELFKAKLGLENFMCSKDNLSQICYWHRYTTNKDKILLKIPDTKINITNSLNKVKVWDMQNWVDEPYSYFDVTYGTKNCVLTNISMGYREFNSTVCETDYKVIVSNETRINTNRIIKTSFELNPGETKRDGGSFRVPFETYDTFDITSKVGINNYLIPYPFVSPMYVTLNSSNSSSTTFAHDGANLTCFSNASSTGNTSIFNWYYNKSIDGHTDWYPFVLMNIPMEYNGTTSIVKDYSIFGSNMNTVGSPTYYFYNTGACKVGGCYHFNDDNSYLNVTNVVQGINGTNQTTLCSWINFDSGSETDNNYHYIFGIGNWFDGSSTRTNIDFYKDGNTRKYAVQGGFTNFGYTVPSGWHHACVGFDGSNYFLWINGALVGITNASSIYPINLKTTGPNACTIVGASTRACNMGLENEFDGYLDEFHYFGTLLDNQTINAMYNEENSGKPFRTIASPDTTLGEQWTCQVTPNDNATDGTAVNSTGVLIIAGDPVVADTPTFSDLSRNETLHNHLVNFSGLATTTGTLEGYIFETNNSGSWANSTYISASGTSQLMSNITTIRDLNYTTIGWKFYANTSAGYLGGSVPQTFLTNDTYMTFTGVTTNETKYGYAINISTLLTDPETLSAYTFSTNNTGAWINTSLVSLTGTSSLVTNITLLNSTHAALVGWKVFANETSGLLYKQTEQTLKITDDVDPTLATYDSNETNYGMANNFSVYAEDVIQLEGYIFSTNNSGTWTNDSYAQFGSYYRTNLIDVVKLLNSTHIGTYGWKVWLNDSSNNIIVGTEQTILTIDVIDPTFSNQAQNDTFRGMTANFSALTLDPFILTGYTFSTNNSGTWINDSWHSITGTSSLINNVTIINSSLHLVIGWKFYANDTYNNLGFTSQTFLVDSYRPQFIGFTTNETEYGKPNLFSQLISDLLELQW